jgi:hypothetical protein
VLGGSAVATIDTHDAQATSEPAHVKSQHGGFDGVGVPASAISEQSTETLTGLIAVAGTTKPNEKASIVSNVIALRSIYRPRLITIKF